LACNSIDFDDHPFDHEGRVCPGKDVGTGGDDEAAALAPPVVA
jgi:hypothetical protein